MNFQQLYSPPEMGIWEIEGSLPPGSVFSQIVYLYNLLETKPITLTHKTFALIGFTCSSIGKGGGSLDGPNSIRNAFAKLPVQKQNYQIFDAGNISCINGNTAEAQHALGEAISLLLEKKMIPIVLGSGHETAFGHYQGIARAYLDKNLGIIHFDSHLDLDPIQVNSDKNGQTSFLQIAKAHQAAKRRFDYNCIGVQHSRNIRQLFEIAKKYNMKIFWADELHQGLIEKSVDFIDRIIDQNEIVYLSICLDVFSSAFAPGVQDTEPLGLLPWHIIPLIRQLTSSSKVISFEISGLTPKNDHRECTAKLAANLIYEFINHYSENPRPW